MTVAAVRSCKVPSGGNLVAAEPFPSGWESMKRRTAWVGCLPYHATEASIAHQRMGKFGVIEKVIVRRGQPPSDHTIDSRESWGLVHYKLDGESHAEDRTTPEASFLMQWQWRSRRACVTTADGPSDGTDGATGGATSPRPHHQRACVEAAKAQATMNCSWRGARG